MKYYLIAGEASGDLLGSHLIKALRARDPQAQIRYWGGDKMREQAESNPVRHILDLAYMGFVEVAMHLRTILGNIRFCKQDILHFHPDVLVTIDYPGFNLKIASFAHQHGIRTLHYVSPQLWAWKKGRITGMRRSLDRLCFILPFEQQFYAQNHFPQAVYVGHPLLDAVDNFQSSAVGDNNEKPLITLLPGSRRQEIRKVLPQMLHLVDLHPEYRFVIGGMSLLGEDFYRQFLGGRTSVEIRFDQVYQLLSHSFAALVCSGTATLETALFRVPQVVCYSANPISIAIARRFIRQRIKYISLPNLIADEPIVDELIQQDLNPARLEAAFAAITSDGRSRQVLLDGYTRLFARLGNSGASDRTAEQIIQLATH